MSELVQSVEQTILNRSLLRRRQALLVAVSGGLDSMVLLHVLHRLFRKHRWRLTVAHFNHQLRGRASDADERLVRRTAHRLGLLCIVGRGDVKGLARQRKLSVEVAARQLRHEFLAHTARARGARTVALAHHADDQVELFFLRLLRGAGGEGLAGMKWRGPSPNDKAISLVRPLLSQPKTALAEYARQEGVCFRQDASNASLDIQRNRIRRELIPLLIRHYQPALARVVLRQIEVFAAESHLLSLLAQGWLRKEWQADFEDLPTALQRRTVQQQVLELGFEAGFDLVEQLRQTPSQIQAVNPQTALCRDDEGRVRTRKVERVRFLPDELWIELARRQGTLKFGGLFIRWQTGKSPAALRPQRCSGCEWFDADKVGPRIGLRHWRPGDRFQPIGMKSPVKLQDWFTNLKIPRPERHRLVVATTDRGEIWWVEGLRISERFKLVEGTSRLLQWRWRRKA